MTTEVNTQLAEHPPISAKIEPKSEKKLGLRPKSHENGRLQKELVVPEILEFTPIQKEPKSSSTYRFGSLSHHSFFSRHHPHPHHMGHIQDLAGNRVCTVKEVLSYTQLPHHSNLGCFVKMPHLSTPVGDPQSNREPLLFSEAWKKELKELSSQLTISTTHQPKDKREEKPEELQREQGAKYSAQTGRLIPPPTRATSHRIPYQTRGKAARRKYGGPQAFILEDQELLVLELLCQILQTDCLTSIQLWLLGAPQKEKELAIRLLNTAVAQLPSPPSVSLLEEKLLSQLQEIQEQKRNLLTSYSPSQKKLPPLQRSEKPVSGEGTGTSNAFAAPSRGKSGFAQSLKLKRDSSSAAEPKKVFLVQPKKLILPFMAQPQQYVLAYHKEPIKLFFPREEDTPPS